MSEPDEELIRAKLDHATNMLRHVVNDDHADVRRRGGSESDLLREAMVQALIATLWVQTLIDELTDLGVINRSDVFNRAGDKVITHAQTVGAVLRAQRQASTGTQGEA